jgi:GntR family phosphonate transport system transcriptional regulator
MIGTAKQPAVAWIAAALGIPAGETVVRVDSLGRADGVPVSRSTSWFDAARFDGIAELFSRTGSVTAALAGFGVSDYRRASTPSRRTMPRRPIRANCNWRRVQSSS